MLSYPADQVQDGVVSPTPSSQKGDKKDKKGKGKDDKGSKDKVLQHKNIIFWN